MLDKKQKGLNAKIVTHNGRFHTDEVFSCATLSLIHGGAVEIVRSRDAEVMATADILVDVGGEYDVSRQRFDHHQEGGAGARENGVPYSSFGLVWKHYGKELVSSPSVVQAVDERLVQSIDASDNGIETFSAVGELAPYLLQDITRSFSPAWNEARTDDEGFFEAVEFAKKILTRVIVHAESFAEGARIVEGFYASAEDKRVIVLDGQYPWGETLSAHPEPLYVVQPERSGAGNWKIEAVRSVPHSFQNRKNFPEAWAGKQDEELAQITGVADAVFCHNKRFVAAARSKEGALELARLAVIA